MLLDVLTILLLGAGCLVALLCAMGVLLAEDVFDRLHFLGPVGTITIACVALAILLSEGLSPNSIKALLAWFLLGLTGPVLTHATARAARVRQFGHWSALPEELVDRE